MPAIASALVHVSPDTGIKMDDFGLRGDEDFLLVHSVEDSAEYREEITHSDISGELCYNALKDPRLVLAYDADCLAFKGLANMHPGRAVETSVINNYLANAFGFDALDSAPIVRYRRPRRKRAAGSLASINFELEIIPSRITNGTNLPDVGMSGGNPVYSSNWPNPTTILSSSGSTTPPPATSAFGYTIFWRRRTTLVLGTILQTPGVGDDAARTSYIQGLLATDPQPADISGFTTLTDPHGADDSEIIEIYHVPSATLWLHDDGSNSPIFATLLLLPQNPLTYTQPDELICRYIAKWTYDTLSGDCMFTYAEEHADLTAFRAAHPDTATEHLVWLYDSKINDYLFGP